MASPELTTLCYLEKDAHFLMLHRVKKKEDINEGKWIGVGGHFEPEESPEECLLREVKEETGLTLTVWRFRGLITFISGDGVTEYMSLFTASGFEAPDKKTEEADFREIALKDCPEGELSWVPIPKVTELSLWEGDRIFLRLLQEREDFFSLKLVYDGRGSLTEAVLDGQTLSFREWL